MEIKKIDEFRWEIPKREGMNVPGRIVADEGIVEMLREENEKNAEWNSLNQIRNVASLPGIQKYSLALADVHCGYGAPIGSVTAMDMQTGVITFGSIGFDINCLEGNTKILHEFGYNKKMKDFGNSWRKERIKCSNPAKKMKDTEIERFISFKPKGRVFRVKTETGREIIATEEHPFFTPKGMVELKHFNGEKIAVYPFTGVEFEEPSEKTIIGKKDIEKLSLKKNLKQSIDELEKRNLLPLKMNNEKFPYLIKLMGYIIGDGQVFFSKNERACIWFYGKKEDLREIRKDIEKIGFKASRVYSREREHSIKTMYGLVEFKATEHSIKSSANSLAALLMAMGLPVGNKTTQDFALPKWLFECPKWQKRLFLASFFGAELTSPKTVTNHGYNFYNQIISMNKKEKFANSGRKFLKQLTELLKEFGVESSQIREREEYKNKAGEISVRLRLQINGTNENLRNLWEKIGFEYNKKRSFLANTALQYLKLKENVLRGRKKAEKKAKSLKAKGKTMQEIATVLEKENVNKRFLERSVWSGRKTSPRIASNFPKFEEFLEEATKGLGETGQVWERIVSREEIPFKREVYDFTVKDENHNFIANNFVVSNCGVRTLRTPLREKDLQGKREELAEELFRKIPAGLGSTGKLKLGEEEIDEVLTGGAEHVVKLGYGFPQDLEFTELEGKAKGAKPENVSRKAKQRQSKQVGTLGSGNHYLEVQIVEEIFDAGAGKAFGLNAGQVLVSIHCGSRALGHQIGMDYLQELANATKKYGIKIGDRELVCAPVRSKEGQKYFSAVNAGMNCAFANRQVLAHLTREAFGNVLGTGEREIGTLYDVGHNTAKIEVHEIGGEKKELMVQRKGSTRGFGPGRKEVPEQYRKAGQPILVGGTMGTYSYILAGTEQGMLEAFGSGVHGAGRKMSRHAATRQFRGEQIARELKERGIIVKAHSWKGAAEEAPGAYKDIDSVVGVMHSSGINKKVARVKPVITVKG